MYDKCSRKCLVDFRQDAGVINKKQYLVIFISVITFSYKGCSWLICSWCINAWTWTSEAFLASVDQSDTQCWGICNRLTGLFRYAECFCAWLIGLPSQWDQYKQAKFKTRRNLLTDAHRKQMDYFVRWIVAHCTDTIELLLWWWMSFR